VDPEARTVGLGVVSVDAYADINVNAAVGTKDAKVMSDDTS
jgi:hypothetical protein